MLIVTAEEMRALDEEIIERVGVPGVVLMESAGRGVADVVGQLPELVDLGGLHAVVFCGPGNNGGDGFVAARHLVNRGAIAKVALCVPEARVTGDARTHLLACRGSGVEIRDASTPSSLAVTIEENAQAEVVIDALLGTGLTRPVEGHFAEVITQVNGHRGLTVAVDIPSGLDSDRGVPLGVSVRAEHTVTFAFPKLGLVTSPGFIEAGQLHVIDIGIPQRLARQKGVKTELLEDRVLEALRRPRAALSHKGTHGHVLLLAGSPGKGGAALLAGRAALRVGAGLVTVAAPRALSPSLDGRVPELMTFGYGPGDAEDALDGEAVFRELSPLLAGKQVFAAGPGVPTGAQFAVLLSHLLTQAIESGIGVVLDADGLNHLSRRPELLEGRKREGAVVLTPHPGEAARLLGSTTADVQADRVRSARRLAERYSAIVVLKGARTVIASREGRVAICPTGNPGLGTGGTGDVLTGCVAALIAGGQEAFDAAAQATYLHGAAGDHAARRLGERSLCAGDVVDALSAVLHRS